MSLAIIGLGYVGLPLAVEFGKQRPVLGFDISAERIAQLQKGHDATREVTPDELKQAAHLWFTDNADDLRNTRAVDVIEELREYNVQVDVHDPWAGPQEAEVEYGIILTATPEAGAYDAEVVAVSHDEFRALGAECIRALGSAGHVLYDLKYLLPAVASDIRL